MTAKARSRDRRRHLVVRLHQEGLPCVVIAHALGLPYHAVRVLLAAYVDAGRPPSRASGVSDPMMGLPKEDTTP